MINLSVQNSLTSGDICGMLLGDSCSQDASQATDWTLDLPELDLTPPYNPPAPPAWDTVTHKTKVLHLSDLHVQLNYTVGSPSTCSYPICCTSDLAKNAHSPPARYWGEYACDLPPWTLEASLASIAQAHPDTEYVLLTGKPLNQNILF